MASPDDERRQPLVFLSYSRADLLWVADLARELRRAGVRTWIDIENLVPGERWRDAIGRALAEASAFVACVSRYSLESRWTGEEARNAADRGLRIIPVVIDGTDPAQLPAVLLERQAILPAASTAAARSTEAAHAILDVLGHSRPPEGASADAAFVVHVVAGDPDEAIRLGPQRVTVGGRLSADDLTACIDAFGRSRRVRILVDPQAPGELCAMLYGAACARVGVNNVRMDMNAGEA